MKTVLKFFLRGFSAVFFTISFLVGTGFLVNQFIELVRRKPFMDGFWDFMALGGMTCMTILMFIVLGAAVTFFKDGKGGGTGYGS